MSTGWAAWLTAALPAGSALHSLVNDGMFAGLGAVLVFLPQILILFLFILMLEESGYLPRAAFLLDRLMCQGRPDRARVHSAAVELCLRDSRHHGHAQHHTIRATASPPSWWRR